MPVLRGGWKIGDRAPIAFPLLKLYIFVDIRQRDLKLHGT